MCAIIPLFKKKTNSDLLHIIPIHNPYNNPKYVKGMKNIFDKIHT